MRETFDRRVVPDVALDVVRACQRAAPCHLAGGAALSGAHLAHRLSADLDLFCHDVDAVRAIARALDDVARETGTRIRVVRDAGRFVRATVEGVSTPFDLDLVHEPAPDIEPPPAPIEGIVIQSFVDLRAGKLACLLERSEPRDLVDVLFLERAGFRPEDDLPLALRKDAGMDPGILAWLMKDFPVEPLPVLLLPISVDALRAYRDRLAERFRALAVPR